MKSLLRPFSEINPTEVARPSIVLVAHAMHQKGHPCVLVVQRERDAQNALTLLQGEFNPNTETCRSAAIRILQNHFEMPKDALGTMVKEVGDPLGYFVHTVPKERKKGTKRTLIYVPLCVSMKVQIRKYSKHDNPAVSLDWLRGRDIDTHASVLGLMRDLKKWEAHVEALKCVLRPEAKQKAA